MFSPENILPTQQNNAQEKTEEYITSLIDVQNIPKELKESWQEYIENAEDDDDLAARIKEIESRIVKRSQLEEAVSAIHRTEELLKNAKFPPTGEEFYFESNARLTQKIKEIVADTISGKCQKIGEGTSASVYPSEKYPELCYKIIEDPVEYEKSCNIKEEMAFLDYARGIRVDGVRTPKPYHYYMSSEIHMCVMERLNAATLQEIIEGKYSLPKNFDIEKQFRNIREFFQIMHKEHHIHHGDFHEKNLMIDLDDGTIYVVDFGKAFRTFSLNGHMHRGTEKIKERLNDNEQIEKLHKKLRVFVRNKSIIDKS